ncbi:erythromycin esterase family protein [Peribacillus deserti]|uniref:Protein-L-isoaspartate O-methyltransferase n=1 Tax=Peribacillus deserti TaxID=673318 RepID=A0A2N5M8A6_9BACI|nr:erythromycin esterase family protein [Peribacillus deserti]PLT30594.1 protein-L-isoaspartate O-methyltransferase [Peribacillus deserti]
MDKDLILAIRDQSIPLTGPSDLDRLISQMGNPRFVLLGEASHGTSEFYTTRAEITKKLIKDKGFTFVAVEGDWPACQAINRYVKGYDKESRSARDVLTSFNRWPTWMWANEEIIDLIEWMKTYNESGQSSVKAGFYGIDVYSLWESMDEVIRYLTEIDSPDLEAAKNAFTCFEPFNRQNEEYAVSAGIYNEGCIDEVAKLLTTIQRKKEVYPHHEELNLNLQVNAMAVYNAENYYRTMVVHDERSWNIRDMHMVDALNEIMDFYGSAGKAIVWEHNTHVGDASATDMRDAGMINVGQVIREQNPPGHVYIVGFGTHSGTVIAADEWGVNFDVKTVPKAMRGSWEDAMHKAGAFDKILIFNERNKHLFNQQIGHRAIGVVYKPEYERYGNYVPSLMSERYDAFIFIKQTKALHPLSVTVPVSM